MRRTYRKPHTTRRGRPLFGNTPSTSRYRAAHTCRRAGLRNIKRTLMRSSTMTTTRISTGSCRAWFGGDGTCGLGEGVDQYYLTLRITGGASGTRSRCRARSAGTIVALLAAEMRRAWRCVAGWGIYDGGAGKEVALVASSRQDLWELL